MTPAEGYNNAFLAVTAVTAAALSSLSTWSAANACVASAVIAAAAVHVPSAKVLVAAAPALGMAQAWEANFVTPLKRRYNESD